MIADAQYDVGDELTVSVQFANAVSGTPVDPTTVTFEVKTPDGAVATYTYGGGDAGDGDVEKAGDGDYSITVDLDTTGLYVIRASSTGTGKAAEVVTISARENPME